MDIFVKILNNLINISKGVIEMLVFIVFSSIFPNYPSENLCQFILSSIVSRY